MAAIAGVFTAGDAITFLFGWEITSVLSYLVVAFNGEDVQSSKAAYVMLAASEVGFLAVVAAWLPLLIHAHSIGLDAIAAMERHAPIQAGLAVAIFVLSVMGFGIKTGLFPTMSWLPRVHPAAPANGSAILSGVILNMGVYGIIVTDVRLLPTAFAWEGLLVLALGSVTALVGIVYAATENDLKRMLAHSSIENLGLVMTAAGVALTFSAAKLPALAGIVWIAALYQLLNHSVYKALLFLGAGAVDMATNELDMDRLGGLILRMPWTSVFMLAGSMAIVALPPFNGFVSEWLILESLLRSVQLHQAVFEALFALGGVVVALTAGLAATAFTRFYGMTFLGRARSDAAASANEVAAGPRWAMGILAAAAVGLGILPTYVAYGLGRLAASLTGTVPTAALIPAFFAPQNLARTFVETFHNLGAQLGQGVLPPPGLVFLHQSVYPAPHVVFAMAPSYLVVALGIAVGVTAAVLRWLLGRQAVRRHRNWAGGIPRLTPEMGYTATGFSSPIRAIFRAILNPSRFIEREELQARHFAVVIQPEGQETYVVDRWVFYPAVAVTQVIARLLAKMHHGSVNAYVAYVLIAFLVALLVARFA